MDCCMVICNNITYIVNLTHRVDRVNSVEYTDNIYSIEVLRHGTVLYKATNLDIKDIYKKLRNSFNRNLVSLEIDNTKCKITIPYNGTNNCKSEYVMMLENTSSAKVETAVETAEPAKTETTLEDLYNALLKEYQGLDKYCTSLEKKIMTLEKQNIAIARERATAEDAHADAEERYRTILLDYKNLRRRYSSHVNKYDC